MSWLVSSAEQRTAAQVDFGDISRTDRLVMLAQLAYVIGWLHKHGWVFGDLSFSNAVFALNPPRILLLDCDGAAALAKRGRKQSSTPFWDPPECPIEEPPGGRKQDRQDDVTDVYKLGLAVLRCLTPGKGASSSRNLSRLGPSLTRPELLWSPGPCPTIAAPGPGPSSCTPSCVGRPAAGSRFRRSAWPSL